MSDEQKDKAHNPGYELSDARFKPIFLSGMALFLVVLVALALMSGLYKVLYSVKERSEIPVSPLAEGRQLPPFPRLQVAPELDWDVFEARQDSSLNSYGWVMQEAGLVKIPIEKAKELALQRGFPARK